MVKFVAITSMTDIQSSIMPLSRNGCAACAPQVPPLHFNGGAGGAHAAHPFRDSGIRPLKRLKGLPRYQSVLRRLGKDWEVTPEDKKELERFTCIIYGYNRVHSIDRVRAVMLQKMVGANNNLSASSKVDLSKLPQCLSSLEPHMQRVNYRLAQWKRSHENIVECPIPEEHG